MPNKLANIFACEMYTPWLSCLTLPKLPVWLVLVLICISGRQRRVLLHVCHSVSLCQSLHHINVMLFHCAIQLGLGDWNTVKPEYKRYIVIREKS